MFSSKTINERFKPLAFFFASILFLLIGYIFMFPNKFGLNFLFNCLKTPWGSVDCISTYSASVGQPVYYGVPYISTTFLLLAVFPQAYRVWKRFAVWALPIMIGIVAMTPVYGEDFGPLPARDTMAIFLAKIFLAVSLSIILYTLWEYKVDDNQKN